MITKYVLGFVFDERFKQVVMLNKQRPEWQKGNWTGVGGKIEPGETPLEAMQREFMEETSLRIFTWEWGQYLTYKGNVDKDTGENAPFEIYLFLATVPNKILHSVKTVTDEEVEVFTVQNVMNLKTNPTTKWFIQMALSMKDNQTKYYTIEEN